MTRSDYLTTLLRYYIQAPDTPHRPRRRDRAVADDFYQRSVPTSFRVTPSKNLYHCFSCDAGGNVIDFVAAMEELEFREAATKLAEWFNITPEKSRRTPKREAKTTVPAEPETEHADPATLRPGRALSRRA